MPFWALNRAFKALLGADQGFFGWNQRFFIIRLKVKLTYRAETSRTKPARPGGGGVSANSC